MDVTDEGYSDANEPYERYYEKITSMTQISLQMFFLFLDYA